MATAAAQALQQVCHLIVPSAFVFLFCQLQLENTYIKRFVTALIDIISVTLTLLGRRDRLNCFHFTFDVCLLAKNECGKKEHRILLSLILILINAEEK